MRLNPKLDQRHPWTHATHGTHAWTHAIHATHAWTQATHATHAWTQATHGTHAWTHAIHATHAWTHATHAWTHATYATRAWTHATYATALFSWLNFIYIQTGNFHVILKLELKTSEERNIKLNMKLTAFGKTWMPKIGNPMSHKYLNNIHCPCQLWVWGRPQESPIIICNCYSNILLLRNLSFKEPLMHVALPFMSK